MARVPGAVWLTLSLCAAVRNAAQNQRCPAGEAMPRWPWRCAATRTECVSYACRLAYSSSQLTIASSCLHSTRYLRKCDQRCKKHLRQTASTYCWPQRAVMLTPCARYAAVARLAAVSCMRAVVNVPRCHLHTRGTRLAAAATAVLPESTTARLASRLTPALLSHVQRHGFAVADGVLAEEAANLPATRPDDRSPASSSPLADQLRERILALYRSGTMKLNHTHLVHAGTKTTPPRRALVPKHSIHEADFTVPHLLESGQSATSESPAHDAAFWREFVLGAQNLRALNDHLEPVCRFDRQTVKAQVCEGGAGCFPMHFDTDRKVDSRRLTAILYLNPSWSSSVDGGSLRLYPFPHGAVDISPIHDRLVLFDSTRMLHRVLPCHRERVCISIWFWQEEGQWRAQMQPQAQSQAEQSFADERHESLQRLFNATPNQLATFAHLLSPAFRPHLAKLYHQREWFDSLEQSHSDSPERQQMLIKFLDEVDMIERALGGPLRSLQPRPEGKPQPEGQAWRSWLPAPHTGATLPPFCQLVEPQAVAADLSAAAAAFPTRLVDWLGSQ